jgi:hypothetical protein
LGSDIGILSWATTIPKLFLRVPIQKLSGGPEDGLSDIGIRDVGNSDIGNSDIGIREVGNSDIGISDVGRHRDQRRRATSGDIGISDIGNSDIGRYV